ncbi:MAG TPA: divalent cation tolerance protein CutA, partial [Nitrospirales bacterium]|nr:divalent cation tolerance protein CutA [Nitrospirales bacterium]
MTVEPEILVLSTTPTRAEAERLGRLLVDKKLVACVNIIPQIT